MQMSTSEIFLIAMMIIFTVPYLMWRLGRTDYYAPLVVVQIIGGILLGPGVLGAAFPEYYGFVFNPQVIAVAERHRLVGGDDVRLGRRHRARPRRRPGNTAARAASRPASRSACRCSSAASPPSACCCYRRAGSAPKAPTWQFVLGIGMACAVTALPILVLLMEKLEILRQPHRPAHPALRQPGRHRDLGRARADPARLGARRPPGRLPGRVRASPPCFSAS